MGAGSSDDPLRLGKWNNSRVLLRRSSPAPPRSGSVRSSEVAIISTEVDFKLKAPALLDWPWYLVRVVGDSGFSLLCLSRHWRCSSPSASCTALDS